MRVNDEEEITWYPRHDYVIRPRLSFRLFVDTYIHGFGASLMSFIVISRCTSLLSERCIQH